MSFIKIDKLTLLWAVAAAVVLISGCSLNPTGQQRAAVDGHEYLLTVTRPNQLHVIDTVTKQLVRSCDVPGVFGNGSLALSPEGPVVYVLSNKWEDVYGFDIRNCELRFSARQSTGNMTVKTFISMDVSADGTELYTIQNPVRKLRDRYEVMQPRLAVYSTAAGLDAEPLRTFPVDRRITKIAAMSGGEVILGGADLKAINPKNGEIRMLSKLQSWDRGDNWVPPDAFAMMNQGEHVGEYIMPYFTVKWNGAPGDMEKAEFWWGMSRVDLATGQVEETETVPFEFIVFNWITDPQDANVIYGAFNNLSKHNIKEHKTLATQDLMHTYYTINMDRQRTLYVGGTSSDISIHDPDTLEKIGSIQLPGDMSTSDLRIARVK